MSKTVNKWSLPVHDVGADQADLPIYAELYRVTSQISEPIVRAHLAALDGNAGADLAVQDLKAFQEFLESDASADASEISTKRQKSRSEAWRLVRESLRKHIAEDPDATGRRLAKEVAQEVAAGVWSSVLGGLEASNTGQILPVSAIVPALGGGRDKHGRVDLEGDLMHLSIPNAVLINIVHQTMHRLLEMNEENDYVQLPMQLRLSKDELFEFLDSQYGTSGQISEVWPASMSEQLDGLGLRIRAAIGN